MKRLLYVLILVLLPSLLFGAENAPYRDYYTWGGTIDVAAEAFRKLALLASDSSYHGLFYGIGVLGLLLGSIGIILYSWARGQPPTWAWLQLLLVLLVGGTVYFGFLKKKDTLFIYDQTTGETTSVSGVPDGVILLSSFFNRIENGLTEMIDRTSLEGLSYRDGTGGIAMQLLVDASRVPLDENIVSIHLLNSLTSYFHDCYLYNVPLGYANPQKLYYPPNNDLMTALQEGVHPSVYTTWYDENHPGGITVSCQVAWGGGRAEDGVTVVDGLRARLTAYTEVSPWVQEYRRAVCAGVGFDVSNPQALSRCSQIFTAALSRVLSDGSSSSVPGARMSDFLRNRIIAASVYRTLSMAGASSQTQLVLQREVQSAGLGMAIAANRYIPALKAAVTAVFLGVLPFIFLFVFTPLWKKVLALSVGSFAFLCMWGVCDALVHSFIAGRIIGLFEHVQSTGIDKIIVELPKKSLEALSLFGIMRMATIFFAGTITKMLFGFGGVMLAHLASSITGRIEAAAVRGGQAALMPEVKAGLAEAAVSAPQKIETPFWAASWTEGLERWMRGSVYARAVREVSSVGSVELGLRTYGSPVKLAGAQAEAQVLGTVSGAEEFKALKGAAEDRGMTLVGGVRRLKEVRAAEDFERLQALQETASRWGVDLKDVVSYMKRFEIGGTAGRIRADLERGLDPLRAALRQGRVGRTQEMAKTMAVLSTYDYARTQLGFKGSLHDFADWLALTQQRRELGGTLAVQEAAERYFGGDAAAAERAWRFADALRGTGEYKAAELMGFAEYVDLKMSEALNEQAKFEAFNYMSNVLKGDWRALAQQEKEAARLIRSFPSYQVFLARHLSDLELVVKSPEEAANLHEYLRQKNPSLVKKLGLTPEDLVGGKVELSLGVDQKGRFGVAYLAAEKGGDVKLAYTRADITRYIRERTVRVEDTAQYVGTVGEAFVTLPTGGIAKLDVVELTRKGEAVYMKGFLPGTDHPVELTLPKAALLRRRDGIVVNAAPGTKPTFDLAPAQLASYLVSPQVDREALKSLAALAEPQFQDPTRRTELVMSIAKAAEQVVRMQGRTVGRDAARIGGGIGIGSGLFSLSAGAASEYAAQKTQEYDRLVRELQSLADRSSSSLEFFTGARDLVSQTIQAVQKRTERSGKLGEAVFTASEKIEEAAGGAVRGLVKAGRKLAEGTEALYEKALSAVSDRTSEKQQMTPEEAERWRSEGSLPSKQQKASAVRQAAYEREGLKQSARRAGRQQMNSEEVKSLTSPEVERQKPEKAQISAERGTPVQSVQEAVRQQVIPEEVKSPAPEAQTPSKTRTKSPSPEEAERWRSEGSSAFKQQEAAVRSAGRSAEQQAGSGRAEPQASEEAERERQISPEEVKSPVPESQSPQRTSRSRRSRRTSSEFDRLVREVVEESEKSGSRSSAPKAEIPSDWNMRY